MGRPLRPTAKSQRASWASPWGPSWGTRRATGTTTQHHPAGPPHPDPAQNLVKHEGFEQPTQTGACGSTPQAHLELIKERGQKKAKKACEIPPGTPRGARETPKTTNHDGTVAPFGHPWPPARGPKRGPRDTLGAPRGPPKQCHTKSQSPLTKNAEDKKRTTNIHPKSDRYLRGFYAPPLRGAVLGDAAARIKHKNTHFPRVLDPGGATMAPNPRILRGF